MRKELRQAIRRLSATNRKTLRNMAAYLATRHLNEIVYEETISDLVGMAQESEQRGQPFSEVVGMDFGAFCRDLVANSPRQTWGEQLLEIMRSVLWCGLCIVPVLYALELFLNMDRSSHAGLVLAAPVAFLIKYTVVAVALVLGRFYVRRATYKPQRIVLTAYLVGCMLTFITMDALQSKLWLSVEFRINIAVWIGMFVVLLLLCDLAKRLIATTVAYRQSKNKNKQIDEE